MIYGLRSAKSPSYLVGHLPRTCNELVENISVFVDIVAPLVLYGATLSILGIRPVGRKYLDGFGNGVDSIETPATTLAVFTPFAVFVIFARDVAIQTSRPLDWSFVSTIAV